MANCENTEISAATSPVDAEAAVLCLINEARAANGVGPLTLNAKLRAVAREHAVAADTIKWWPASGDAGHIPHVNPVTGKDEQVRIKDSGYCPSNPDVPKNENCFTGYFTGTPPSDNFTTPAAAVEWWLNSDGHRRTLLDPQYTETGVGVVHGTASQGLPADAQGGIYVQTFGGCEETEPVTTTQLWGWGANGRHQLGDGSDTSTSSPVHPAEFEGFTAVAASYHSVGLKADETVWTWGPRENKGPVAGGSDVPVQVPDLDQVVAIAAGYEHNLAVRRDGTVWAWGDNRWGQLGDDSGADQERPVQVRGLSGIKSVAAGGFHSLALGHDGSVWGWGLNGNAQLAHDPISPYENFDRPIRISPLQNRIKAIAAGNNHTIALEADTGQMWVFGSNIAGCLGTGAPNRLFYQEPTKPAEVDGFTGRDIQAIAANQLNSYAVDQQGRVWAMGSNTFHQFGINTDMSLNDGLPHRVSGISGVVEIAAGFSFCLALRHNNDLWSWGSNSAGQLGRGLVMGPDAGPGQVSLTKVTAFSAGWLHGLAVAETGE
jgi:alpha-tubulin suppressor-like RCC1 family protein/uncharacterized protein YkwD